MNERFKGSQLDFSRYLYHLTGLSIISILALIALVSVSINVASGMRAYVAGEGYWTKAQKGAALNLQNYIYTGDSVYYLRFRDNLEVNLGDRRAREELSKKDFDYVVAFDGFREGRNHPRDIPHLISVYRKFRWFSKVQTAISVWEEADRKIEDFILLGTEVDNGIATGMASEDAKKEWSASLWQLDNELTELEVAFSNAMGDMARFLEKLLKWSYLSMGFIMTGMGILFVYSFIKSTRTWAESLKQSEEEFRTVLVNSKDVLLKFNFIEDHFEYVSPGLVDILGFEARDWMKGGKEVALAEVHPDDVDVLQEEVSKFGPDMTEEDYSALLEFRIKNKEGEYKWVNLNQNLVYDQEGKAQAIVANLRDVTQQKELNNALRKSLEEKEVIIREIHHRIKNNLAIITGILELQKNNQDDEHTREILSKSQYRIKSISRLHEKLYKGGDLKNVQMDMYFRELIEEMGNAYSSGGQEIRVELDLNFFEMGIEQAVPCGLVLSEIITNAYKHGFKGRKKGTLRVSSKSDSDSVEIIIENNGNPMPQDLSTRGKGSFGTTLINVLVRQLRGSIKIESGEWTRVIIHIELSE